MKKSQKSGVLLILSLLISTFVSAQKGKVEHQAVLDWKTGVSVNGDLEDWDNFGQFEYLNQGFQYQIGQDQEALYVAIRIVEVEKQIAALGQGFSISFNSQNKKKIESTITFPLADRNSFREIMANEDQKPQNARIAAMQAVRGIHIRGFKDLTDGLISINNQFGIVAAAVFDDQDALCLEYKIPFREIGINLENNIKSNRVYINLKLGATTSVPQPVSQVRQAYPNGYGGYGGYGRPTIQTKREDPGLWLKLNINTRN